VILLVEKAMSGNNKPDREGGSMRTSVAASQTLLLVAKKEKI